jgi:hypothetical protein
MTPDPRRCGAALPDGGTCEQQARVLSVQYVYEPLPSDDGTAQHALRETRYNLACPTCGPQKYVEKHSDD